MTGNPANTGKTVTLIFLLLAPLILLADDTEVYLTAPVEPLSSNILIIIDQSARMSEGKLETVKNALLDGLLSSNSSENVHAAIMSYHSASSLESSSASADSKRENEAESEHNNDRARIQVQSDFFDTGNIEQRSKTATAVSRLSDTGRSTTVNALRKAAGWYENSLTVTEDGFTEDYLSPVLSLQDKPLNNRCRPNSVILLSTGLPERTEDDLTEAGEYGSYRGTPCDINAPFSDNSVDPDQPGLCAQEIVRRLNMRDMMPEKIFPGWQGRQRVTSYTIGIRTIENSAPERFLKNIAYQGGGFYYSVDSAKQTATVLKQVIDASNNAIAYSYAPPDIPFNPDRALVDGDFIYIPVFYPEAGSFWKGNLFKFRTGVDEQGITYIRDRNGRDVFNEAFDFQTGLQDYWSNDASDAGKPVTGGVASVMNAAISTGSVRTLYTWLQMENKNLSGKNAADAVSPNRIHPDNKRITAAMTGVATAAQRLDILSWVNGLPVAGDNTADNDAIAMDAANTEGSSAGISMPMGAPLHSKPVAVKYPDGDKLILINTTAGVLHAFDTDGREIWAFIPQQLLPGLAELKRNVPSSIPYYGLDGPLVIHRLIDKGATRTIAVFGMRRGGRSLFALDISNRTAPVMLWQITGGSSDGFARLGQTWSIPRPVKMEINGGEVKDVLVFGGGYDPSQDDMGTRTDDAFGNAVYVIDALSGNRLAYFSADADHGADGTSLQIEEMVNGVIGLQTVDINSNGIVDRLYVTDVAGRIFRIDIPDRAFPETTVTAGLIADINADSSEFRRFFNSPELAYYNKGGEQFLAILIGSGFIPAPLDNTVTDRFYMIKDTAVWQAAVDSNGVASYHRITEDGLYNASENILQEGTANEIRQARSELAAKHGWYIDLLKNGEKQKAFSIARIFNSIISFTTFQGQRSKASDMCTAGSSMGSQSIYAISLLDGTAAIDINKDDLMDITDRSAELPSSGLPGSPTIITRRRNSSSNSSSTERTLIGLDDTYSLPDRFLPVNWQQIVDQYPPAGKQ